MKRLFVILLSLTMIFTTFSVFAEDGQKVTVLFDGEQMTFDVDPIIENGRTLVPFRGIFESLGCNVAYRRESNSQIVMARRGESVLFMAIGENFMVFDGKTIPLDVPAKIVNGRTLVPVRAVSEAFEAKVEWDGSTRTVKLSTPAGDHKITPKTVAETLKEGDINLMEITITYPVIENVDENEVVSKINEEYETNAQELFEKQKDRKDEILSYYNSKSEVEREMIFPLEYSVTYNTHIDKDGLLSLTCYTYSYSGEEGIDYGRDSKTYDLEAGELQILDILDGKESNISKMISEKVQEYFTKELDIKPDRKLTETIRKAASNPGYYLSDSGLKLYFSGEQIPNDKEIFTTVEIPYDKKSFKIQLEK